MSQSRRFLFLMIPLAAILAGWYATTALLVAKEPVPDNVRWVRTAEGWEKAWWLRKPVVRTPVPVHPALVASLMLFASAGLLIASHSGRQCTASSDSHLQIAPEDRL